MNTKDILIIHPDTTEKLEALTTFLKAFKLDFEISKTPSSPYNPDFVAKIKKSRNEIKNGNGVTVKKENLSTFLGL
jgi:hypothetical protein